MSDPKYREQAIKVTAAHTFGYATETGVRRAVEEDIRGQDLLRFAVSQAERVFELEDEIKVANKALELLALRFTAISCVSQHFFVATWKAEAAQALKEGE